MSGKQFVYASLDVKNMKIISSGNLDIPLPEKDFNYGGIMSRLVGNKLYVAYMFLITNDNLMTRIPLLQNYPKAI